MTLLNVERIKLFTTRSPYWCLAAVFAAVLGFAVIFGTVSGGRSANNTLSQSGFILGLPIFMVLSALAVTTEYRFGTIRSTFLAVPQRPKVLIAKTVLLAVLGAVVGVVGGLAAWFLTKTLAGTDTMQLSSGVDYRVVLGHGVLLAFGAIIAVAVATMVRQSAGAVAIVLIWPFVAEQLFSLIPTIGPKVQPWLPFTAGNRFVSDSDGGGFGGVGVTGPTPVQGLLVFIGSAVVLWLIALLLLQRRDA